MKDEVISMNIDKQIEFYRIKEMWSELAVTDHAKDRIKECDLYFSEGELRKQLKDTTDARAMIEKFETVENRKKRHDMKRKYTDEIIKTEE